MRSFLKFLITALGLVLVLIGVGAVLAGLQAERTLKSGLERTLSYVFLAEATVETVDVAFLERSVEVKGLTLANPANFREGTAIQCDSIVATIDPRTLISDNPTITKVMLEGTTLNIRYELGDGTNLKQLAENAARLSGEEDATAPRGARRSFLIEELRCEGAQVELSANVLPASSMSMEVAPFVLADVGDDRPITTAELSVVVLRSFLRETMSFKGLAKPVVDLLRREFKGLRDEQEPEDSPPGTE